MISHKSQSMTSVIGWSHISQSQITQLHNTEKIIEGSEIDNII